MTTTIPPCIRVFHTSKFRRAATDVELLLRNEAILLRSCVIGGAALRNLDNASILMSTVSIFRERQRHQRAFLQTFHTFENIWPVTTFLLPSTPQVRMHDADVEYPSWFLAMINHFVSEAVLPSDSFALYVRHDCSVDAQFCSFATVNANLHIYSQHLTAMGREPRPRFDNGPHGLLVDTYHVVPTSLYTIRRARCGRHEQAFHLFKHFACAWCESTTVG